MKIHILEAPSFLFAAVMFETLFGYILSLLKNASIHTEVVKASEYHTSESIFLCVKSHISTSNAKWKSGLLKVVFKQKIQMR